MLPELLSSRTATTALALAVCAAMAALAYHRHFTPARGFRHRKINWMVVCLAFVAVSFVLLVHLVNLAGFETGRG